MNTEQLDILTRCINELAAAIDWESSFYEAQKAVEEWALDAVTCAGAGDFEGARKLLDRYSESGWTEDETPTGARPRSLYRQCAECGQHYIDDDEAIACCADGEEPA